MKQQVSSGSLAILALWLVPLGCRAKPVPSARSAPEHIFGIVVPDESGDGPLQVSCQLIPRGDRILGLVMLVAKEDVAVLGDGRFPFFARDWGLDGKAEEGSVMALHGFGPSSGSGILHSNYAAWSSLHVLRAGESEEHGFTADFAMPWDRAIGDYSIKAYFRGANSIDFSCAADWWFPEILSADGPEPPSGRARSTSVRLWYEERPN